MTKEYAVQVDNISKSFRLPTESTSSLKRTLVNYFKGVKGYYDQTVLKNISFNVEKGDFFGIVGRNGSGKSTLLKIISQIYVPETGSVSIDGKLVSFIELGVGFNPELTGKENVYLNGAMLGFSPKEIDDMYEDIVNFAELKEFMNQKLKNYSSGMQVRLAFSVAIQSKSDILVLDEVLAVGDEAFQRKCNDYFMKAKEDKKTIILVTHSMDAVRKYCNKALMIEKGEIKVIGSPDDVANQYSLSNLQDSSISDNNQNDSKELETNVSEVKLRLLSETLLEGSNRLVEFEISYNVLKDVQTYPEINMVDIDRNIVMYSDNNMYELTTGTGKKNFRYKCTLEPLNQCKLRVDSTIKGEDDEPYAYSDHTKTFTLIISPDASLDKSGSNASGAVIKRSGQWQ